MSATVDEDMNFMTEMRKNRKDGRKEENKGNGWFWSTQEQRIVTHLYGPAAQAVGFGPGCRP